MPGPYNVKFDSNVPVMLRDGTITYADVCRPAASGKFPSLLMRTPYSKDGPSTRTSTIDILRAASRGYSVVVQDIRGRYTSDGEFYPFVNEALDGYDSVEWVASQPWSSGKVGMFGSSYLGATQWLAATARPPALRGIAAGITASDYHEGWAWQGGAFELGFNLSWSVGSLTTANWKNLSKQLFLSDYQLSTLVSSQDDMSTPFNHLPLKTYEGLQNGLAPYYYDWLEHPEYDDYWRSISIEESHPEIEVPAYNYGGWYDIFLSGTVANFTRMHEVGATKEARDGQRLVLGPWAHGGLDQYVTGEYNFGTKASFLAEDVPGQILRFYDYWLHEEENGLLEDKPVRIFVMGDNVWRDEDEWPLTRAVSTDYYLRSEGKANTVNGDGSLALDPPNSGKVDVYLYNPADPVPTHGGALCCEPASLIAGVRDQRVVESRPDVLVYTSEPMGIDTEVTGPVTVTLYASTSALDTDFTAKLVDVEPSGYARNLCDSIIRARYRTTGSLPSLLAPGEIYELVIDLGPTSNVFKEGHQIRLEVSSSNFPRFDRNMNTGDSIGTDATFVSALQTVYHSPQHPSRITLPVVPRD